MYIAFYWIPLLLTKFYLYVRRIVHEEINKKISLSNDIQVGVGQIGVNQVSDLEKMRVDSSKKNLDST